MEEDKCYICELSGSMTPLYNGIYDRQLVKVCEKCADLEKVNILSRADVLVPEKRKSVYERLQKISGVDRGEKRKETGLRFDKIREAKKYPDIKIRQDISDLSMKDNFNWILMRTRRGRGLTQERVAQEIGEDVFLVKMAEQGKLPERAMPFIEKLEKYYGIRIRNDGVYKNQAPSLRVLMEKKEQKQERKPVELKEEDLDFSNPNFAKTVTIEDLKRLQQKKEGGQKPADVAVSETIEEQQKPEKSWWARFFGKREKVEQNVGMGEEAENGDGEEIVEI